MNHFAVSTTDTLTVLLLLIQYHNIAIKLCQRSRYRQPNNTSANHAGMKIIHFYLSSFVRTDYLMHH
jgi:hypothetical protein